MRKPTRKQLENTLLHLRANAFLSIMARNNAEALLNQQLPQIQRHEQQLAALPAPKPKPGAESEPEPESESKLESEVKEEPDGSSL